MARAKACQKPAYPPGLKPQRLAAGSFCQHPQDIGAVFTGPVKDSVVGVWQLFTGMVMITRSPPPGASVLLDGLKVILGTPVLDDFQLKLRLCELLLIEAIHVQYLRFWLSVHCLLATKLGGL